MWDEHLWLDPDSVCCQLRLPWILPSIRISVGRQTQPWQFSLSALFSEAVYLTLNFLNINTSALDRDSNLLRNCCFKANISQIQIGKIHQVSFHLENKCCDRFLFINIKLCLFLVQQCCSATKFIYCRITFLREAKLSWD